MMATPNYTKGNWTAKDRHTLVYSDNGENEKWKMRNICQVYGETVEEREANAKLISAAPDMLAALMELRTMYEKSEHIVIICDKAINKATL